MGRRSSVSGNTPKLQRRLEVRKIFDQIDRDGSGTVTIQEFEEAMELYPNLSSFFASKIPSTSSLFKELDIDGNGEVSWNEFLQFLQKVESNPDVNVSASDFDKFFAESVKITDEELADESLVQDVVMEVTFFNSQIYVAYMSANDTRVALEPDNKLLVNIDTDAVEAAKEHVRDRNLDELWIPEIEKEVYKGILYACEKSIDTMTEAKKEISEKLLTKGKSLVKDENLFHKRVDEFWKKKHDDEEMQKVAAVLDSHKDLEDLDKTGFEGEAEVEAFLKNRMPLNFNELNAELSTLKTELEEFKAKEEANKKREEEEQKAQADRDANSGRRSSVAFAPDLKSEDGGPSFASVDADGDGKVSRDEWRMWADGEIAFLEQSNKEKVEIMAENKRLRSALMKPSAAKQEEMLMRQDIEMAELNDALVEVKLQQDQIEAELAVAITS
ncbi:hypothetical protein TrVE_jg818 [Triparma verrucosa]|uniref:EF-hand domain-containing protein n=1 Tax=Triparma verrucosa TaxID=1606542 RepID=A0A9W7DPI5_9STRA|nr:hypothetical protein TrVE_jg818 [Triparma verrucosa]